MVSFALNFHIDILVLLPSIKLPPSAIAIAVISHTTLVIGHMTKGTMHPPHSSVA